MGKYLQISFKNLRNFALITDFMGLENTKVQHGLFWLKISIFKVQFLKSLNEICRYPPKELLVRRFSQKGSRYIEIILDDGDFKKVFSVLE